MPLQGQETLANRKRSYYRQLRSDWLMFFRLRNGGGKIALGEGWFVLSFDRHTMHWCWEDRVKSELGWWLIWIVIRLIDDLWSTSSVQIVCRRRMMSECRKSSRLFQVVRGGQLHWLLAWLLHVYRLLTRPKLGGERRLEAEEIRRSSGGFRPRWPWKLHALFFIFLCAHTLCSLCNIFLSMYEIFS